MQWNGKRIFNTRGDLQKRNADTLLLTDWLCLGSILFLHMESSCAPDHEASQERLFFMGSCAFVV